MHPPPQQVKSQLDPPAHAKTQPPPTHEPVQLAPAAQTNVHPPPRQVKSHVEPALQLMSQPAPLQVKLHDLVAGHSSAHALAGQESQTSTAHPEEPVDDDEVLVTVEPSLDPPEPSSSRRSQSSTQLATESGASNKAGSSVGRISTSQSRRERPERQA